MIKNENEQILKDQEEQTVKDEFMYDDDHDVSGLLEDE